LRGECVRVNPPQLIEAKTDVLRLISPEEKRGGPLDSCRDVGHILNMDAKKMLDISPVIFTGLH